MLRARHLIARLDADRRGSTTIIFGLSSLMLMLIIGLAIDVARAYSANTRLASLIDQATLAAARNLQSETNDDEAVRQMVDQWVKSQVTAAPQSHLHLDSLDVDINRAQKTVTVNARTRLDTHFARMANIPQFTLNTAAAATFKTSTLELSLMLDVSGSMEDYGKIDDLKAAVAEMIDVLKPANKDTSTVRVAMAPYSSSVNPGAFAGKVRGGSGKCVSERKGQKAFTDDSPKGNPMGGKPSSCPASTILPLTNDRSTLLTSVDAMKTGGATAGHLGAAWAWYLVSPNWAEIWPEESKPSPYSDKGTSKAVVLMTDGMFNTAYEADNGDSPTQAQNLCANMKTAGVRVYTVAFQAPASVMPTLQGCASSPAAHFDATDASALTAAFKKIAEDLSQLRLSR